MILLCAERHARRRQLRFVANVTAAQYRRLNTSGKRTFRWALRATTDSCEAMEVAWRQRDQGGYYILRRADYLGEGFEDPGDRRDRFKFP